MSAYTKAMFALMIALIRGRAAPAPAGLRGHIRVRPSQACQVEPVDVGTRGEGRDDLQSEHAQCLSLSTRAPFQREAHAYWRLSSHEELPKMRSRSLVGFTRSAEDRHVAQHQHQTGYEHRDWRQGARLFHLGAVHQKLRGEWSERAERISAFLYSGFNDNLSIG